MTRLTACAAVLAAVTPAKAGDDSLARLFEGPPMTVETTLADGVFRIEARDGQVLGYAKRAQTAPGLVRLSDRAGRLKGYVVPPQEPESGLFKLTLPPESEH